MASFLPTAAMAAMQIGVEASQRSKQAEMARASQDAQARFQVERIRRQQMIDSRRRQQELKEALAAQRARFGAQGVGLSGSSDVVLNGLAKEAGKQERESRDLANARAAQINNQTAWSSRRNLLDASQPTFRSAFKLARRGLQSTQLFDF